MCKQTTVHFAIYRLWKWQKPYSVCEFFDFGASKHKAIDQSPSDPKLHNKQAREIKIKF